MFPSAISKYFGKQFTILRTQNLSGGCINDCFKLETSQGNFFIKLNSASASLKMFEAEAKGLELLALTKTVKVPRVIEFGETEGISFLLLEFLERGSAKNNSIRNLGSELAQLHQCSSVFYGLEFDNYIGSLPQSNKQHKTWIDFFVHERILPQMQLARCKSFISKNDVSGFERLFTKLPSLFSNEKPALLHGDLWNGNFLIENKGAACLIDPAVYYGNREMDLAMTHLFGGFNSDFYSGYDETFPLEKNWQQRIDLYNLYPLLVHVNLFGYGYVGQLQRCLRKYI